MSDTGGGLDAGRVFLDVLPRTDKFASALGSSLGGLSGKFESLGGDIAKAFENPLGLVQTKLSGLGAALPVAGVLAGAAAIGAGLFAIGDKFQHAYDTIRAGTGATGAQLKSLEGDFKSVVSSVPTSFGDAADAVTKLHDKLDITGKPLQSLSDQMIQLGRVTHTDVNSNIDVSTKLIQNWQIPISQAGPKLDELFRASQKSGVGFQQLAQEMTTAGPIARQLGLTYEQTAGLVAQLDKAGVPATIAMTGLRRVISDAAKEGKAPQQAFEDLFNSIKNAKDPTQATALAVKDFGTRAGPALVDSIRSGRLDVDAFAKSISSGGDTIMKAGESTEHLGEKFTVLKNRLMVDLEPVAMAVFNLIEHGFDHLGPLLDGLDRFFAPVIKGIKEFWDAFQGGSENPNAKLAGTIGGIERVGLEAGAIFTKVKDGIVAFWDVLTGKEANSGSLNLSQFDTIIKVASSVREVFEDKLLPAFRTISEFIEEHVKPIVAALVIGLGLLISPVGLVVAGLIAAYVHFSAFRDVVNTIAKAVAEAGKAIVEQLGHAVDFVRQEWPQIKEIIGGVMTAVRVVIETVVGIIETVWNTFGKTILIYLHSTWDNVKEVIKGAVDIIRGILELFIDLFTGKWGKLWGDVKTIVHGAWEIVQGILKQGVAELKEILSLGLDALKKVWDLAWTGLKGLFDKAWAGVKAAVSAGADAVVDFFKKLPGRILDALNALGKLVAGVATDALKAMGKALEDAVGTVLDFFKKLPLRVIDALVAIGKFEIALYKAAWDGVVQFAKALGDKVVDVLNFFKTLPQRVIDGLKVEGHWLDQLYNVARDGLVSFLQAIHDKEVDIFNWAKNLPGAIWQDITDSLWKIHDVGADLVNDFINGVKSIDLIGAMKGVFGSIADTVKGWLGIKSPSSVFHDIGRNMTQGMINGIKSKHDELQKQMQSTFGGAVPAGNVTDWLIQAIGIAGVPMSWLPALYQIAVHESGGDPHSVNLTDSNAAAGHPSKGLMQTIDGTFNAYAVPGHHDIFNPVDNAAAAIKYIQSRYGSVDNVPGIRSLSHGGGYIGYEGGGPVRETGPAIVHAGEFVLSRPMLAELAAGLGARTTVQDSGRTGPVTVYLTVQGDPDPMRTAALVKDGLARELNQLLRVR